MNEPYPIVELSAKEAAWRSVILGTRRTVRGTVADVPVTLTFHSESSVEAELLARVDVGSVQFWVGFSDWNRVPGVTKFLDGGPISSIPLEVLPAVLEAIFVQPLDRLTEHTPARVAVVEAVTSDPEFDLSGKVGIVVSSEEGVTAHGFIAGDAGAMSLLCELAHLVPSDADMPVDDLSLVVPVEIGRTQLTVDELKRLKRHDVVVMESTSFQEEQQGRIRFHADLAWQVTVGVNSVTCVAIQDAPTIQMVTGSDVAVLVAFQKGFVKCPLRKLATLDPESVLSVSGSNTMTLSVNGMPFASGELVQLGEKRGVRLLSQPAPVDLSEHQTKVSPPDQPENATSLATAEE